MMILMMTTILPASKSDAQRQNSLPPILESHPLDSGLMSSIFKHFHWFKHLDWLWNIVIIVDMPDSRITMSMKAIPMSITISLVPTCSRMISPVLRKIMMMMNCPPSNDDLAHQGILFCRQLYHMLLFIRHHLFLGYLLMTKRSVVSNATYYHLLHRMILMMYLSSFLTMRLPVVLCSPPMRPMLLLINLLLLLNLLIHHLFHFVLCEKVMLKNSKYFCQLFKKVLIHLVLVPISSNAFLMLRRKFVNFVQRP